MTTRLVIGAKGQLGTDLVRLLTERGEPPVAVDIDELDLCDHTAVRARLLTLRPAVVLNLAAYHQVDLCETHQKEAFATNAVAVHNLAVACSDVGATLAHFSTDFVFDGDFDRRAPFTEEDLPSPQSVYATSKLAGEHLVRQVGGAHLVIRSCGLYGVAAAEGRSNNFIETMLRLAGSGKPIRVVDDQRVTPTATIDLAGKVLELLEAGQSGLFHVTNGGSCTWHEFAAHAFKLAGLSPDLGPTTAAEFGAAAKRPAYSVLSNDRLRRVGLRPPRHWKEALADYMKARQEL
jgi:dTDP-4-dehydrorhamnose reductase